MRLSMLLIFISFLNLSCEKKDVDTSRPAPAPKEFSEKKLNLTLHIIPTSSVYQVNSIALDVTVDGKTEKVALCMVPAYQLNDLKLTKEFAIMIPTSGLSKVNYKISNALGYCGAGAKYYVTDELIGSLELQANSSNTSHDLDVYVH